MFRKAQETSLFSRKLVVQTSITSRGVAVQMGL
jgi:hypothetical protein